MANQVALQYGVPRETLINLVSSENPTWNPQLVSYTGDYGLGAINLRWHPEVTEEQAFDPIFGLSFAAKEIKKDGGSSYTVCNCYQFVKAVLGKMPPMVEIAPNGPPEEGGVAILDYRGKKHVAVIVGLTESGVEVREANFEPCKTGTRIVEWSDPFLKGFYHS